MLKNTKNTFTKKSNTDFQEFHSGHSPSAGRLSLQPNFQKGGRGA